MNRLLFIIFFISVCCTPSSLAAQTDAPIDISVFSLTSKPARESKSCLVELSARLIWRSLDSIPADFSIRVMFHNPTGQEIARADLSRFERDDDAFLLNTSFSVNSPLFWTAETPHLYRAVLECRTGNQLLHSSEYKVGLRQVSIQKKVLRLNGVPLQIRGINYGYQENMGDRPAIDLNQWKSDLEFLKQANVNTIRVPEASPLGPILEACDRAGLYVVCGLPNPRRYETEPAQWMPALRQTINRHKKHPSVIVWSLDGLPVDDVARLSEIVREIKSLDPSRPVLIPDGIERTLPEEVDLLAPVNPSHDAWAQFARSDCPVLAVSHTPPADGAFEGLDAFWDLTQANSALAGGMIHRFADSDTADGIVDKDRTPHPSYWQARKIYSPVRIIEREAQVKPGRQTVRLTLHNNYDFTNLRDVTCRWFLVRGEEPILRGGIELDLAPRRSKTIKAVVEIPSDLAESEYTLVFSFIDKTNRPLYEHSVRLKPANWEKNFLLRLEDLELDESWRAETELWKFRVNHRNFSFTIKLATAEWFMMTHERHIRLITGGPYLRLGRKGNSVVRAASLDTEENAQFNPPVIERLWAGRKWIDTAGKNAELTTRLSPFPDERLSADIGMQLDVFASPYGFCDVRFTIEPEDRDSRFQEVGLAFLVPSTLDRIAWLGDGPFPSYPGQSALSARGVFRFHPLDGIVPGNRANVDLVALTNQRGDGLGIMLLGGNIAFEPVEEGTLVSVNSAVAGLGNGAYPTRFPLIAGKMKKEELSASFRLIPLIRGRYPQIFQPLASRFDVHALSLAE